MSDDTKQIKIMRVDDHPVLRQGMTITPHVIAFFAQPITLLEFGAD